MADEEYFGEYEDYNYGVEYDKLNERMKDGGHGKHKESKERQRYEPSGNVRKVVSNIQNSEKNKKEMRKRAGNT